MKYSFFLLLALVYSIDASAQFNAQFVSQSVPSSMVAGQSYPVSVTMRNKGITTWTNTTGPGTPNAYSLGSQSPQDNVNWGLGLFPNRVPVTGSVAPGGTTTFSFNVVAPATPVAYDFQWQMVDDYVTWFGDQTPNVKVTVTPASIFAPNAQLNAQFVSQNVPESMTVGQSHLVSVTLRNSGNTTWANTTGPGTPNAYSLGSRNPQDNVRWGLTPFPTRVPVTGSVAPGATTTFTFEVVAPATLGTYDFQWQMVSDYVAWFGDQTPNVKVSVLPASGLVLGAQFVRDTVPRSMTVGQTYPVSVTLRNTGTATWTNTTGPGVANAFSLGSQNPQDNVTWGLNPFPTRIPVKGSVTPGASTTFAFNVVAPATPGIYNFQWQMVDDGIAWFGDSTPNMHVVVESPLNFVPGPISFAASPLVFGQPVIGDVNGDGWLEPFGTINDGTGRLAALTPQSIGVANLLSDVRPNDFRVADLDGDGCPDMVAQGYSAYSATMNSDSRAMLYFNDGTGKFTEDPSFASLNLNGRGEGLAIADFNNDGLSDLYLPYYTFGMSNGSCDPADQCPNSPQSYLLRNDGTGHFVRGDVPGTVDLALPPGGQPEGTQAVDVNDDGLVDLYVSGRLFLNRGVRANGLVEFADCNCGVPSSSSGRLVEEGAKFLDWDDDGKLDLLLHDANEGPQLYHNIGTRSQPRFALLATRPDGTGPEFGRKISNPSGTTYASLSYCASYGINIYDMDNDGNEDVVVAGSAAPTFPGCDYPNVVFRNTGAGFESVDAGDISGWQAGGVSAFGDINRDGRIDMMFVGPFPNYFVNATNHGAARSFTVDVRGPNGQENAHGRVVRVSMPQPQCTSSHGAGCTLTRVVDSGSGYHAQNAYPILIGTPYTGAHAIEVIFPALGKPSATVTVTATASPSQYVQILAPSQGSPNGRVIVGQPAAGGSCRAR